MELVLSIRGVPIHWNPHDEGYANATEMAKACGKWWSAWHQTDQAREFIEAVATEVNILTSDLILSIRGGDPQQQQAMFYKPPPRRSCIWPSKSRSIVSSR